MKPHCGPITWLNLSPLQTGQWDGNKRSPRDQLQSQLIPITPVEINREGSEWRRWEWDESAPPRPSSTSLICQWSRGGRSDKGQGLERDKKGPNVPHWPGPSPRSVCACGHPAVSGEQPGKPPRWCCPSLWYECDCVLLVIQNAGVYF